LNTKLLTVRFFILIDFLSVPANHGAHKVPEAPAIWKMCENIYFFNGFSEVAYFSMPFHGSPSAPASPQTMQVASSGSSSHSRAGRSASSRVSERDIVRRRRSCSHKQFMALPFSLHLW
jgi:hypothetical protein